jgi:hypothetical protein
MLGHMGLPSGHGLLLGHRCLQDVERMNHGRFTLNGKHQIFLTSEDCLFLNIYSPAEATAGAQKPVCSPKDPVHFSSSTLPTCPSQSLF